MSDFNFHRDAIEVTFTTTARVMVKASSYEPARSLEAVRAIEIDNAEEAVIALIQAGKVEIETDVLVVRDGAKDLDPWL